MQQINFGVNNKISTTNKLKKNLGDYAIDVVKNQQNFAVF